MTIQIRTYYTFYQTAALKQMGNAVMLAMTANIAIVT